MSYLRSKSNQNTEIAESLFADKLYCAIPHCSYYSCIQLMKYILLNFCGYTEEQLDDLRKKNLDDEGRGRVLGSHEVIFDEIDYQVNRLHWRIRRDFLSEVNQLKTFRVLSDYKDVDVTLKMGSDSITMATNIRNFLFDQFKTTFDAV